MFQHLHSRLGNQFLLARGFQQLLLTKNIHRAYLAASIAINEGIQYFCICLDLLVDQFYLISRLRQPIPCTRDLRRNGQAGRLIFSERGSRADLSGFKRRTATPPQIYPIASTLPTAEWFHHLKPWLRPATAYYTQCRSCQAWK